KAADFDRASAKRRKQDAGRLSPALSRPSTCLTLLRDRPLSRFRRLSKLNVKLMSSRIDHAGRRSASALFPVSPAVLHRRQHRGMAAPAERTPPRSKLYGALSRNAVRTSQLVMDQLYYSGTASRLRRSRARFGAVDH